MRKGEYQHDKKTKAFADPHHRGNSVYLLLDRVPVENDADRRKLYVGMTRAKENLYIHCNTDIFDACRIQWRCWLI